MKKTVTMIRYARGFFDGGDMEVEVCPSISKSAWEHNNVIKEYEDDKDTASDKAGLDRML